jgi:rhamnulose-1-phosphate aldolase
VQLPVGVGVVPFILPGSPAIMAANVVCPGARQVALWGKHGVMARSDHSATRAAT